MSTPRPILLLALGALSLAGCARSDAAKARPLSVAVLFSGKGRGDHGFNDAALAGAERAEREFGVRVRIVDPAAGSDETALARTAAREGADLVIGVGFPFSQPLQAVASDFPATRFIGVDMDRPVGPRGEPRALPENVAGITFREDEGAFLVGALAAMSTRSNTVGFVGGMRSDVIRRFEDGYREGARYVCPSCRVLADYVGDTPLAFASPGRADTLASAQFSAGADVIFHAAGLSGNGVIDAARRTGKLAIGADIDQSPRAPGHVLTSMQKSVDVAVYEAIKRARQGHLQTGVVTTLGLAQNGVGYVYNAGNSALITPAMHARVEELRASIVSGRIVTRPMAPDISAM